MCRKLALSARHVLRICGGCHRRGVGWQINALESETHVYVERRYQRTNLGHTVGTNPLTPHTRCWKEVDQSREKEPTMEESPSGLYDSSITDRSKNYGGGSHMLLVNGVEETFQERGEA